MSWADLGERLWKSTPARSRGKVLATTVVITLLVVGTGLTCVVVLTGRGYTVRAIDRDGTRERSLELTPPVATSSGRVSP